MLLKEFLAQLPEQIISSPPPLSPSPQTRLDPKASWKRVGVRWAIRLVGTSLLLFFLWRLNLDWDKVAGELARANLWAVGASVGLVLPFIAAKAWRWQDLLAQLGLHLPFGQAYRLYALGLSAASFTPGQSGDLIKAWQLKKDGFPLGLSIVSIVLDRLFDIAVLLLLASSGLVLLGADFGSLLPPLLSLLAGIVVALLALGLPSWRSRLLTLAFKLFLRKKVGATAQTPNEFSSQLPGLNLIRVFATTLLASGVALGRVWLLALALGLQLGPLELIAASSLATVVSLLPVSVGGIGARDLVLAYILQRLGYPLEKAVSLATFILLLQVVNLAAGYLIWATRSKKDRTQEPAV